jgi:hypothetical protein
LRSRRGMKKNSSLRREEERCRRRRRKIRKEERWRSRSWMRKLAEKEGKKWTQPLLKARKRKKNGIEGRIEG